MENERTQMPALSDVSSDSKNPKLMGEKPVLSDVVSEYMRGLAKKSHVVVKERYGREHYVRMGRLRHVKGEKAERVVFK